VSSVIAAMSITVDQALVTLAKQLTPADRLDLTGELWKSLKVVSRLFW